MGEDPIAMIKETLRKVAEAERILDATIAQFEPETGVSVSQEIKYKVRYAIPVLRVSRLCNTYPLRGCHSLQRFRFCFHW